VWYTSSHSRNTCIIYYVYYCIKHLNASFIIEMPETITLPVLTQHTNQMHRHQKLCTCPIFRLQPTRYFFRVRYNSTPVGRGTSYRTAELTCLWKWWTIALYRSFIFLWYQVCIFITVNAESVLISKWESFGILTFWSRRVIETPVKYVYANDIRVVDGVTRTWSFLAESFAWTRSRQ
jgi:hypothetical protein